MDQFLTPASLDLGFFTTLPNIVDGFNFFPNWASRSTNLFTGPEQNLPGIEEISEVEEEGWVVLLDLNVIIVRFSQEALNFVDN